MAGFDKDIPPIITATGSIDLGSAGSFAAGTSAFFFFTFVDLLGQPYDPFDSTIIITNSANETVLSSDSMDKIELGKWAFNWGIPTTTTPGKYTLTLTYVVETGGGTTTETFTEEFLVLERGTGYFNLRQFASREFLESLIGYVQRIPIFHETARFNKARTVGKLSFPRWNQTAGAEILLNETLKESGFTIDYWKGQVIFDRPLQSFDDVKVSYNFRWLTEEELDNFVEQGINMVNIYPPASAYGLNTIPDYWMIAALYGGAINVIRRLLMDFLFAEPIKIFGSLQRAQEVWGNLDSLKKNYEDMLFKLLEQKKNGPYAGLTRTITTPEFALPGGRCFAWNTQITYRINETVFTATIAELFDIYENGSKIEVLSHNDVTSEIVYTPISKIWSSGVKTVYTLTTENGKSIETSDEHLFYIVGKGYIPLQSIVVGDKVVTTDGHEIAETEVTSIIESGEQETFDIEVPETENLFANEIKCHNSRWFRYLFKGG